MTKKQSFNLEIMGHQQLLAALNDLPDSMTKKAVRAGARSVAKKVKTEAERRAPKDDGHLKKSFKVRALSKKGRRYNREGRANKKFFEGAMVVTRFETVKSPDLDVNGFFYPAQQEYGWEYPKGTRHEAQPFLRPALYSLKSVALSVMRKAIASWIRKQKPPGKGKPKKPKKLKAPPKA